MFETLKNAWRNAELRKKLLYTLFILFIFRLGASIPVPFINRELLANYFATLDAAGGMLSYINVFTGGGALRMQPCLQCRSRPILTHRSSCSS